MKQYDVCNKLDKSIRELNHLNIKLGYFLAKTVGILFLGKTNIVIEEQERLDHI